MCEWLLTTSPKSIICSVSEEQGGPCQLPVLHKLLRDWNWVINKSVCETGSARITVTIMLQQLHWGSYDILLWMLERTQWTFHGCTGSVKLMHRFLSFILFSLCPLPIWWMYMCFSYTLYINSFDTCNTFKALLLLKLNIEYSWWISVTLRRKHTM